MRIEVVGRSNSLPGRAAERVAAEIRCAVAERDQATVAFSGGETAAAMLSALAAYGLPWHKLHVFQTDEYAVTGSHPERQLGTLRTRLLAHVPVPARNVHPMPVVDADLDAAAARYATTLAEVCGDPPVLDLVHLSLSAEGHTASLVPGDPVVDVADCDVAATGPHRGMRRLTLTCPALNRARRLLWVVSGAEKADALGRLIQGDPDLAAARVVRDHAELMTDVEPSRSTVRGTY